MSKSNPPQERETQLLVETLLLALLVDVYNCGDKFVVIHKVPSNFIPAIVSYPIATCRQALPLRTNAVFVEYIVPLDLITA